MSTPPLVIFGARVRRKDDFARLFANAQLELVAEYPTPSQFSILEVQLALGDPMS